jgi:outer membrane protein assembly factor BamB
MLGLLSAGVGPVWATPVLGGSYGSSSDATLYDLDAHTGLASHPRVTGLDHLVGIAFLPTGALYGLTSKAALRHPNSLFQIDPVTGNATLVGATGLAGIVEGDLTAGPDGRLYGLYDLEGMERRLFTVDPATGAATVFGTSLAGDPSGMAFGPDGRLYVVDTSLRRMARVDAANGEVLSLTPLNPPLGATAAMVFDRARGLFLLAEGGGSNQLYTLNPATGQMTLIGSTGLAGGLAGMALVPEPATAFLVVLGGLTRARRHGARP